MAARITLNKKTAFFGLWLPVLLCMAVIFYASSVPGDDIPGLFPWQDIAFHFAIYMILGFLSSRAIKNSWNMGALKVIISSLALGILYAASDEFHQLFVAYRTASIADILIDSAGNLAGGILYRWLA